MATRSFLGAGAFLLATLGCRGEINSPTDAATTNPAPSLDAVAAARVRDRGVLATASYMAVDTLGCGTTRVDLLASQGASTGAGASTPRAGASVSLSGTNWCTGEEIWAEGSTAEGVLFRVSHSGASLQAVIPADGNPAVKITVDMTWSSGAVIYWASFRSHPKYPRGETPDTSELLLSKVTTYFASPSGKVSMGGDEFAPGPWGWVWGSIERYREEVSQGREPATAPEATRPDRLLTESGWGPWAWSRQRWNFGSARFRSLDNSGCIETFTTVQSSVDRAKEEATGPSIDLHGFQIDHCTGVSGLSFYNITADADRFQVEQNHRGASLRARVQVEVTESGGWRDTRAAANIVWTGLHLADHGIWIERVRQPGCESTGIAKGSVYDASARGRIILDGTNLTPEPAFSASFGENRFSGRGHLNGCDD